LHTLEHCLHNEELHDERDKDQGIPVQGDVPMVVWHETDEFAIDYYIAHNEGQVKDEELYYSMDDDRSLIVKGHQCPETNDCKRVNCHRYQKYPVGQGIREINLATSVFAKDYVSLPKNHEPPGDIEEEGRILAEEDDSVKDCGYCVDDRLFELEIPVDIVHYTTNDLAE